MNDLREEARALLVSSEAGRMTLLKYYRYMSAADARLPFSENALRVEFIWQGVPGFSPSSKLKRFDAQFEMCSVLINAGVMAAQQAIREDFESETGVKRVCQLMQIAAGCWEAAKRHSSPDRCGDEVALECWVKTSLGQAQECFVWQAERAGKAGKTVAILAWGAEQLYREAEQACPKDAKGWKEKIQARRSVMWGVGSVAESRDADEDKGTKHGEKIGLLEEAQKRMKESEKWCKECGLDKQREHYLKQAEGLCHKLRKENETIYFARVVARDGMGGAGRVMVKALALPEEVVGLSGGGDPFTGLVAHHVVKKVREYEERRKQVLEAQHGAMEMAQEELRRALQDMGLPGALDGREKGIPSSLASRCEEVRRAGGEGLLLELSRAREQLRVEDVRLLDRASSLLGEEESPQVASSSPWQTSALRLTLPMRQEEGRLRAALDAGSRSDDTVRRKMDECGVDLRSITQGTALDRIPQWEDGGSSSSREDEERLRQSLQRLDLLARERISIQQRLRDIQKGDDAARELSESCVRDDEAFQGRLDRMYGEEGKKAMENGRKQKEELDVLREANRRWRGQQNNAQQTQRELYCQRLQRACQLFQEIQDNLREGVTYYTDLQALLVRLARQVEDFCLARQTERREYGMQFPPQPPSFAQAASAPPYNSYGYH